MNAWQKEALRALPKVDDLLRLPVAREAADRLTPGQVAQAVRDVVASVRRRILAGETAPYPGGPDWDAFDWAAALEEAFARRRQRTLRHVINATGVVLHTNLGRAPLCEAAVEAVAAVARSYSNLEYDLERGARGERHVHGEELLVQLTGAEAAMVVNNNAAAVLLVLSTLAAGREVVLSRGEMIEIGGSFRIPEVLAQSGARLVEVGTTNRTHLRDYEQAIGPETAALLKVHTSNFRVSGFTKSVPARELAPLARSRGVYLLEDLGSGVLVRTEAYGLRHEPAVQEAVAAGADLVTFSGDKLLGGPQAGIIVGRRDLVERCRRHPLARALRVDKLTLAALQATLQAYARGTPEAVPVWRMIAQSPEALRRRAEAIAGAIAAGAREDGLALDGEAIYVEPAQSAIGGGALPGETLPTWVVAIRMPAGLGSLEELAAALRRGEPAVVGRIEEGALRLDPRTLAAGEDGALAGAVRRALGALARRAKGD